MNSKYLTALFIASFLLTIVGAFLKITQHSSGETFMIVALISGLLCLLIGAYEVITSQKMATQEKVMWIVGFLFLGWIALFVYLIIGRKRIVNQPEDKLLTH